jgi:hypothetical protein
MTKAQQILNSIKSESSSFTPCSSEDEWMYRIAKDVPSPEIIEDKHNDKNIMYAVDGDSGGIVGVFYPDTNIGSVNLDGDFDEVTDYIAAEGSPK